jgi:hypothetical protein
MQSKFPHFRNPQVIHGDEGIQTEKVENPFHSPLAQIPRRQHFT